MKAHKSIANISRVVDTLFEESIFLKFNILIISKINTIHLIYLRYLT